ncbi:MAG: hypothetical protein K8S56_01650 [Candidatus Cloacimonetes bacterium]|nr:hypothetical protein [Candidatus Cloacimonadota bacterium]
MEAKKKAAIAAVVYYLSQIKAETVIPPPINIASPWTLNSRMTIMTNRSLLQRRVIKRR